MLFSPTVLPWFKKPIDTPPSLGCQTIYHTWLWNFDECVICIKSFHMITTILLITYSTYFNTQDLWISIYVTDLGYYTGQYFLSGFFINLVCLRLQIKFFNSERSEGLKNLIWSRKQTNLIKNPDKKYCPNNNTRQLRI